MQIENSVFLFNVIALFVVAIMAMVYTYSQMGDRTGWRGPTRYALFGVFSFVLIGFAFVAYIVWLYLGEYSFIVQLPIGMQNTFDLANGFFTVIVGCAIGIFITLFAVLKYKEYGRY